MTGELNELYQQVILDHNKSPKNFRVIEHPTREQEGYNPLCGDHLTLYVRVEHGVIEDIGFQGSGCAISKASCSMMTAAVKGKSVEEAENMIESFRAMTGGKDGEAAAGLGSLRVFEGVREFPARVKCAVLAWHTLRAALEGGEKTVTTEEENQ